MRICLVYVAVSQGVLTADYCARFVGSYLVNPPGIDHQTVIAANGGPLPKETALLFDLLPCSFLPRVNDPSWDIGAFMDVAAKVPCDMLVCLGESLYFHRPGWLAKIAEAWAKHGPGMYGLFSSHLVRAHLNTTGFACAPSDLLEYPRPTDRISRYDFEHGEHSFWRHVHAKGKPAALVTWDGVWFPPHWRVPGNILWRGSQENCLAYCCHNDRYRAADADTKKRWARWADWPFR